jgi:hypothetical protein
MSKQRYLWVLWDSDWRRAALDRDGASVSTERHPVPRCWWCEEPIYLLPTADMWHDAMPIAIENWRRRDTLTLHLGCVDAFVRMASGEVRELRRRAEAEAGRERDERQRREAPQVLRQRRALEATAPSSRTPADSTSP